MKNKTLSSRGNILASLESWQLQDIKPASDYRLSPCCWPAKLKKKNSPGQIVKSQPQVLRIRLFG